MIPVNEPLLGDAEQEAVAECLRTGWISSAGPYLDQFERGWAEYCGRRYGISVVNGTAALQVAVDALRLGPGDEVILPSFTIMSCALAVVRAGATPVLVDADPVTWTMDVQQVAARVTARTRAIMPVHIYGHPVDMDPLLDIATDHGLALIEDAAEAHGAEYLVGHDGQDPRWVRCGSFGDVSCFSFYANKLLTTGEGGMILTDDQELAERSRSLRNLCFQPGRRFFHEELGYNFRLTNLQAALGVAQLGRMEAIVARKRAIAERYSTLLGDVLCLQLPIERAWAHSVYWMYGVVVREEAGLSGSELAERLAARGVETRPFFLGLHEQPVLRDRGLFADEQYPVTEVLARQGLYLPSGLALTDEQIHQVAAAVKEILL